MNFEYWIELKRADFLSALKTLKPTLRVKSAPPRELQIGFEDSQVIFAIQGNSATKPATGNWPGLAEIKLSYFLSFLVAKPIENEIRIKFINQKIYISSAIFPAKWIFSEDSSIREKLHAHSSTPGIENVLKFKCQKCRKKQGVAFVSLSTGPLANESIKDFIKNADMLGHGFGCLSCGNTWDEQEV